MAGLELCAACPMLAARRGTLSPSAAGSRAIPPPLGRSGLRVAMNPTSRIRCDMVEDNKSGFRVLRPNWRLAWGHDDCLWCGGLRCRSDVGVLRGFNEARLSLPAVACRKRTRPLRARSPSMRSVCFWSLSTLSSPRVKQTMRRRHGGGAGIVPWVPAAFLTMGCASTMPRMGLAQGRTPWLGEPTGSRQQPSGISRQRHTSLAPARRAARALAARPRRPRHPCLL